jgi:hypothetical protein
MPVLELTLGDAGCAKSGPRRKVVRICRRSLGLGGVSRAIDGSKVESAGDQSYWSGKGGQVQTAGLRR